MPEFEADGDDAPALFGGPEDGLSEPGDAGQQPGGWTPPAVSRSAPLAVRMRPATLAEVLGQDHLLGPGAPLRRLVEGSGASSVILYGPPGTGKTTLASLISSATGRHFESLSALSAGVKDVRAIIDLARKRMVMGGQTVLFIDEVHRFSKTQQDALLSAVENRIVLLVAATTENPSFSVVSPLLSRSLVLQLHPLSPTDIRALVHRALVDERGLGGVLTLAPAAEDHLVQIAGGDARRALTALEAVSETALSANPAASAVAPGLVDLEMVEASVNRAAVRYDRDGDQHYDVASAFIKSIRGSDVDAAMHYLARMLTAGEDPRFVARRLVISASEDIGMADPTSLPVAVAAAQAVQLIGMPEAQLTLSQATIHLASAAKSGSVTAALAAAKADIAAGKAGMVPPHLRDGHYSGAKGLGNAVGYKYPHDHPDGVLAQQYAPDELVGVDYYQPTGRGAERDLEGRVSRLRRIIRGLGRTR